MLQFTNRSLEDRHQIGDGQTVVITSKETTLSAALRSWSAAWTYRRPRSASVEERPATTKMIPDYVMLARIAIVSATIAMTMRSN